MTHDTKFIFFGTPEFAAIILEKLIEAGFAPSTVVCNPDRPVGRKKMITPPSVKRLIADGGWPASPKPQRGEQMGIFQPATTSELLALGHKLLAIKPGFAVVAAYAKIIPKEIIALFPRGIIGVHPSLLPKYRGATPIQSAILAGEAETGVTLYLLDEKVDHGRIASSVKCQVSNNDSYQTLMERLANLGGELLIKTIPDFLAGKIKPVPQDEAAATYTKKFSAEDAFIAPGDLEAALRGDKEKATVIDRKIRALNPEPGVWTVRNEKRIKLLEAVIGDEGLVLRKIQIESKKPQTVGDRMFFG